MTFAARIFIAFTCLSWCTSSRAEEELNIAMIAAFVSESGVDIYQDITTWPQQKTGIETHFIYGLSYPTVNRMLEDGAVNSAFVCG